MLNSLEYKTGPKSAIWPWGTLGTMGVIGRLGSAISLSLVLTDWMANTESTGVAFSIDTLTAKPGALPLNDFVKLVGEIVAAEGR